jgi:hypothetical protein
LTIHWHTKKITILSRTKVKKMAGFAEEDPKVEQLESEVMHC